MGTRAARGTLTAPAARRWEARIVVLVALHSYAVGFGLLFLTEWGVRLGGWTAVEPLFFARQAGVFHFLVATGYLLEYFRNGTVTLLLTAKATAVLFLVAMMLLEPGPWIVPASAAADLAMLVVVAGVRSHISTSRLDADHRDVEM